MDVTESIEHLYWGIGQDHSITDVHEVITCDRTAYPDSKVHVAHMGPTWVLSAPGGPHVGPMKLAIRVDSLQIWLSKNCMAIKDNLSKLSGPISYLLTHLTAVSANRKSQDSVYGKNTRYLATIKQYFRRVNKAYWKKVSIYYYVLLYL